MPQQPAFYVNHSRRYNISGPVFNEPSPEHVDKVARMLEGLSAPIDQNWRFVILDSPGWQKAAKDYNISHGNRGAFTNLQTKTTYVHRKALESADDTVAALLAHEIGHRRTMKEADAEKYARENMKSFHSVPITKLAQLPYFNVQNPYAAQQIAALVQK